MRSIPSLEGFKNRLDTCLSGNSLYEIDLVIDLALQLKDRLDDVLRSLLALLSIILGNKTKLSEAASDEKGRVLWEEDIFPVGLER